MVETLDAKSLHRLIRIIAKNDRGGEDRWETPAGIASHNVSCRIEDNEIEATMPFNFSHPVKAVHQACFKRE